MRAAILLAAGGSRRFGSTNKLLALRYGKPLVAHAVAVARRAPVARLIVVVGAQADWVAAVVRGPRIHVVRAYDHAAGLSASLRAALAALWPVERELLLYLGDMPAIPPHLPHRLARALRPGIDAARPAWRARPGHPVLMRRPSLAQIAALSGDRGLAPLLGRRVAIVPSSRGTVLDVDHPRTLRVRPR